MILFVIKPERLTVYQILPQLARWVNQSNGKKVALRRSGESLTSVTAQTFYQSPHEREQSSKDDRADNDER